MIRTLAAAALVATAFAAPLPAADASCHFCALPVDCEAACDPVYDVFAAVESRGAVGTHEIEHAACHLVADNTGINLSCDH